MPPLKNEKIEALAQKWLEGKLTPSEEQLFNEWYNRAIDKDAMLVSEEEDSETFKGRVFAQIKDSISKTALPGRLVVVGGKRRKMVWAAAAAVLIIMAAGVFRWINNYTSSTHVITSVVNDVLPGSTGATVTFSDGRQLVLDSTAKGLIADEKGSQVMLEQGHLSYQPTGDHATGEYYNTVSTPIGRVYQLTLADGTGVWLNAGSSITFPTAFAGNTRQVTISGEAYFEVAKDKFKPFLVQTGTATVEVLGTHFNINGYSNEPVITTTLLEGSVRMRQRSSSTLLTPGQQVQYDHTGDTAPQITWANTEAVMAWKNGYFQFNDTDLKAVMRELSRWYDVTVQYEGNIPTKKIIGEISKNTNLSEVLQAFSYTGIHFRIEGKTIIVTQ